MSNSPLTFGYLTNGFLCHRLEDILDILHGIGYGGVDISLDVHHANPYEWGESDYQKLKHRLQERHLRVVVGTDARYLLDRWHKQSPVLASKEEAGRRQRIEFTKRVIDIAGSLSAETVSMASGPIEASVDPKQAWRWLVEGCAEVSAYAEGRDVKLALEPMPEEDMLVRTIADFERLRREVGSPALGLLLDILHVHCSEPDSISEALQRGAEWLTYVHICDGRDRVHNHLIPGEGVLDLAGAISELIRLRYRGFVGVELNRHSTEAPEAARQTFGYLQKLIDDAAPVAAVEGAR
jgi:L-ribulose-5-phosphate 3-epimerase